MKKFTIEALFILVAITISLIYVFNPVPFWMALFLFIAQPCLIYAVISTAFTIKKDLRSKNII